MADKPERLSADRLTAMLEGPLETDGSPRDAWKDQEGFNVFSLGDWLGLCASVSVPHVPARQVAQINIRCLLRSDEHPDDPALKEFDERIEAAKKPQTLLRWDACAPEMVKHLLANGQPQWSRKMLDWFTVDDPRAFDILYEFPDRKITVWSRPWVSAAIVARYPVEYRVFVHGGRVRGIANYYVQRPLAEGGQPLEGVWADVGKVRDHAGTLAGALPAPIRFGPAAKRFAPGMRSFTADFMRLDTGELVFLEGGPPLGAGAHPCCLPADPSAWDEAAAWAFDGIPVALVDVGPESGRTRPGIGI